MLRTRCESKEMVSGWTKGFLCDDSNMQACRRHARGKIFCLEIGTKHSQSSCGQTDSQARATKSPSVPVARSKCFYYFAEIYLHYIVYKRALDSNLMQ